jgi:hypothetical protein
MDQQQVHVRELEFGETLLGGALEITRRKVR